MPSDVARRSALMKSGLSYQEAQGVIMAERGHEISGDIGENYIKPLAPGETPFSSSPSQETMNVVGGWLSKANVSPDEFKRIWAGGEPDAPSPQEQVIDTPLPVSAPKSTDSLEVIEMMPTLNTNLFGNSGGFTPEYTDIPDPTMGTQTGLGNIFSGLGDMLPLMLIMGMFGGKSGGLSSILPMLMILPMLGAGSQPNQQFSMNMGGVNVSQVALWALLPKMGSMASFMLGGVSGMLGQSLKSKRRTYRRRSYGYRRRYYRRRY